MHPLGRANNRIHWAGLNTFCTSNTAIFFYQCKQRRIVMTAATAIIPSGWSAQQTSQGQVEAIPTWRAMITIGLSARHGLGIGPTPSVATLTTLRLG